MEIIKKLKTKTKVLHDFNIKRIGINYFCGDVASVTLHREEGGESVRFNKSDIEILEKAIKALKGDY